MNILVAFPTELELGKFSAHHTNHSIETVVLGIGMPISMYTLIKKCSQTKYDLIIHAGIAGAFNSSYIIGDVVQVASDCFGDIGLYENQTFSTIFDMGFANPNKYPFVYGKLILADYPLSFLKQASGITVNTITSNQTNRDILSDKYNADIESMEGASVHYIALQEKISCIHIRAISNYVGERNKANWDIQLAIKNLHLTLNKIIETL